MLIGALFWALALLGCGYAAAAGGRDGRWAAILVICASLLSIPAAHLGMRWARTEVGVMGVDLLLLVALWDLALRSRRFFPLWMAGFQLVAVATHLATLIAPDFTPRVYRGVESLWAIPVIVSMALGAWLDDRARPKVD